MRRAIVVLLLLLGVLAVIVWRFPLDRVVHTHIPGLEAEAVTGTIWDGEVRGARYQGLKIGDVDLGLIPETLLRGAPQVRFDRLQGPVSGRVLLSRQVRRVEGVTGELGLPLGRTGLAVRLEMAGVALETDPAGNCRAVEGQVQATLTGLPILGATPPLAGAPLCEGQAIAVPLAPADDSMGLKLKLHPDRRWDADLSIMARNPVLRALLQTAGFALASDRAVLRVSGELGRMAAPA